jgi:hypothetical protein
MDLRLKRPEGMDESRYIEIFEKDMNLTPYFEPPIGKVTINATTHAEKQD